VGQETLKITLIVLFGLLSNQSKADFCGEICSATWWMSGRTVAEIKLKLDEGNSVLETGYRKNTDLHRASLMGDPQSVQLLLNAGANVMAKTLFGYTPLHKARTVEIAKVLINAGAPRHSHFSNSSLTSN
jgi:hypothetical protein